MLPEKTLKSIMLTIVLGDYFSELILLWLSATLFYYTEFETPIGFVLTTLSTLIDWYYSYQELKMTQELSIYTMTAIK